MSTTLTLENKHSLEASMPVLLGCYSFTHALVDATCAATVLGISAIHDLNLNYFLLLILLYNVLAFGTQALFGLAVDKYQVPRSTAIAGCILTACSAVIVFFQPLAAVIFAGIGNSLYHVGGGAISLNLMPGKTTAPGIFVAPGALGLAIGIFIGKNGYFIAWPFILLLIIAAIALFLLKTPEINYERKKFNIESSLIEIIIMLLLFSISIRALVALSLTLPWKANISLLIALTIGVVAGKAIGGILADKFGWMRVGIAALLISAPLLAFGYKMPLFAIAGAFLFQMTMPITLVAIATIFTGRPAFAFGLPCLALIIGALPAFTEFKFLFENSWVILLAISCSLTALFFALLIYFKSCLNDSNQKV